MKKLMLSGALVLASMSLSAQEFYTSFSVGYGLGLPGEKLGTNTTQTATSLATENIYGTFGQGLGINLSPGYFINDHFGFELGLNYFMGAKVTATEATTPYGTLTAVAHSNQLRLNPSVVLRTGTEGLSGYARLGIIIPALGTTFTDVDDSGTAGANTDYTQSFETKGAFSVGFSGALGANYALSDKLSVFGEVNGSNLRINAKSRTMTAYSVHGTDMMSYLTTYDKEVSYVDQLDGSSNNSSYNSSTNTDNAKEDLRTRNNFSGLFFNIGVKFNF